MKTMYCFTCDIDNIVDEKIEKSSYTIHNRTFDVVEKCYYCHECGSKIINDTLDEDLSKIYDAYLKLFDLSFKDFKDIRTSYSLSQETFAKVLGWSKRSIIRYENKTSLPQLEYLFVYKKIKNNKMEFLRLLSERKSLLTEKEYREVLNSINSYLDLKSINAILYILDDNYMTKTQIMKNMFAVDFTNYKEYDNSITNFKYAHADYGPIIDNKDAILNSLLNLNYLELTSDIYDNDLYKPIIKCDESLFSNDELKVMRKVKEKLKGLKAGELTEWSHKFEGWIKTKNGEIIDYKYAKELKL